MMWNRDSFWRMGVAMDKQRLTVEQMRLGANTLRMLAVDAVEKANSGHPGLPMGAADYAFTLWHHHLRFNCEKPDWPNRDRFILSAGHGPCSFTGCSTCSVSTCRWTS